MLSKVKKKQHGVSDKSGPALVCFSSFLNSLAILVLYFGSQVVADVTDVSDVVLHRQGHLHPNEIELQS
jgi:hypothetical protein